MTEDRNAAPKVKNPHGFSIEWLRIEPGNTVGPFRTPRKQVMIVREGALEIELDDGAARSTAVAKPWDTFACPADVWRTLRSVGDEPMLAAVVTSGDGRALLEWDPAIVRAAWEAGVGIDPNNYLAPASFLPDFCAPEAKAA